MKRKKYQSVVWIILLVLALAGCGAQAGPGREGTESVGGTDPEGGVMTDSDAQDGVAAGGEAEDDVTAGGAANQILCTIAECSHEDDGIRLTIPEGWSYAVEEYNQDSGRFGIRFWPQGPEGAVGLYCRDNRLLVCGTGLETQDITFESGLKGSMGTFDRGEVWDFITFQEVEGHYVALTEDADEWWSEYREEAMEILGSAELGADE